MKRCSRCTLPETYPGISFDQDGVCSRCPKHGEVVTVVPLGEERLHSAIDGHRGKNKDYDCLVGLSGGRDSTYALYYAVKVLGLRVLAFTIDNGLMPQQTHENVRRAVDILQVDHITETHDLLKRNLKPVLSAWLRRPSPAMIPFLCVGCRLELYRGFLRIAKRYQVPLLISGLGEPESSFAMQFFASGSTSKLGSLVAGLASEMIRNPRYPLMRPSLPYWLLLEYLYAFSSRPIMKDLSYPEMHHLRLFEYTGWDEQQIMTVIQSELGWENYGYSESAWRSDCKVSLLKNHLYYELLGFTKNDELVSNLIRLGTISREEGLARVERENVIPERFLREFLEELHIPYHTYQMSLAKMREFAKERIAVGVG
jgi:hypothetical protein